MNALERVRFWQVAVLLVVIKLGLHVGAYGQYALHRDELLYFNQGEYPGLGNPTVPPFIGWVAFLVKALFGHSVFGVRLLPARRMVNYAALAAIVLFSLLSLPLSLPVLSFDRLSAYAAKTEGWVPYPFSRWEDGKKHAISQVFSDMTGWEELVGLVHKAYLQIPEAERKTCTIYAERNYGYAGAVHFYGKKYGLPDAITFLDAYTLWAPDTIPNAPLIYIHYDIAGLDQLFDAYSTVGEVENPFFREKGVKVFLCQKPKAPLQEVYKQKAAEEKRIYSLQSL
ncbi:MAG: hypothetical protein IPN20_01465 [Haliscomenobacter sp.]|nr:hypothetical protein [Haliscomenobacter sp.]